MRKLLSFFIGFLFMTVVLIIGKFILGDEGWTVAKAAPFDYENLELLPEGTFNVQIQALEVTQGIRGDIPSRMAPDDSLTLPSDGAVHIADRHTVVRAYPWISTSAKAKVPPLSAKLWGYRDGALLPGSPISPENALLEDISPDRELRELRSDANLSWNFLLPSSWTASGEEHKPFTLRFLVEVNPPGLDHIGECQDCTSDNQIILEGQTYVHIPPITIKPYLVDHIFTNNEGDQVSYPGPTLVEFRKALNTVYRLFPIGDLWKGIIVLDPEFITWNGPLKENGKNVFAEAMIEQYFPGGSLENGHDGVYHIFVFSPSVSRWHDVYASYEGTKTGMAWIGKPYVQAWARGSVLAHELAHAIGLDHAGNNHGETSYNPDYPDNYGRVEPNAYGFDIWLMKAIPPDIDQDGTHDFMSYNSSNQEWVSIYTWKKLAQLLGQPDL